MKPKSYTELCPSSEHLTTLLGTWVRSLDVQLQSLTDPMDILGHNSKPRTPRPTSPSLPSLAPSLLSPVVIVLGHLALMATMLSAPGLINPFILSPASRFFHGPRSR